MTLRYEPDNGVYIVVTNSFDGNVRMSGSTYLSTGRHGSGLGLISRYKGFLCQSDQTGSLKETSGASRLIH